MTASSIRSQAAETSARPMSARSVGSDALRRASVYNADQQVRYLQLQAEMETLLLELQTSPQRSQPAKTR
ncbi:MAG: hypothetical protein ACFB9N_06495 [Geitlerinemataceae cyanobacterium]